MTVALVCGRTHSFLLPLLGFVNGHELLLVPLEVRFKLGCPMEKLRGHAMDFSFHVVLVALDLQDCVFTLSSLF